MAIKKVLQIFTNQTTNGSSLEFDTSNVDPLNKEACYLGVSGTFDGASIQLEWKGPDDNWASTGDDPIVSEDLSKIEYGTFTKYRLTLSNAGASTSINAWIYGNSVQN